MNTLNLVQGTAEWAAHRLEHFNASDAPAMMGCSPYKTRTQLLDELVSGLPADVNEATQRLFDDGHRFEALARPLAEKIIGSELYPVVGTRGRLSASFDGLTMLEDVAFEHKTLNDSLRAAFDDIETIAPEHREQAAGKCLPLVYQVQCEHQCIVSPTCTRVLFMASRWADDGTLIEERHCWYTPNPDLAAQIIAGWEQFERDLHTHVVQPKAVQAVAEVVESLPAVSVRMDGAIAVVSNLDVFGAKLKAFVASIDKTPSTDQAFANCEAAVKTLQRAEDALDQAEAQALAQIDPVEAMRRAVADYRELARTTRLMIDKLVKARKETIRGEIVATATTALTKHMAALNAEIAPMSLRPVSADFGGAIKGKRTVASLQDAVNTTLAAAKIAANTQAQAIRANLAVFKDKAAGHEALFADLHVIVHKAGDDFALIVSTRIAEQKAREDKQRIATIKDYLLAIREGEQDASMAKTAADVQKEIDHQIRVKTPTQERFQEFYAEAVELFDSTLKTMRATLAQRVAEEAASPDPVQPAPAPAPVSASTSVTTIVQRAAPAAPEPKPVPDDAPPVKLGDLCKKLGFVMTAAFVEETLGIAPASRERGSFQIAAQDLQRLFNALTLHIERVAVEA